MNITIREAQPDEIEELIPLLLLAEPSERALRWGLANLSDAVYRMDDGATLVGVATMQWRGDPCEIEELAIRETAQGQGLGRQFIHWLMAEARRRRKKRLLVGTPNSNLPAIAFYQKLGLRMEEVRQDYFRYYREPLFMHGIEVRDMLVFGCDL